MARRIRKSKFESRTSRLDNPVRKKPYHAAKLGRGLHLLYRRNQTGGTWIVKASDGHGAFWTQRIAVADDHDESNGKDILTFFEAQDQAKRLARGEAAVTDGSAGIESPNAPITVDAALDAYKADLIARSAKAYNAEWPRKHLPAALRAKPVAALTSTELTAWRDGLGGKIKKKSTVNRLTACLKAALTLAAKKDERIQNVLAWGFGLEGVPIPVEEDPARNVILSDDQVRAFVVEANRGDDKLGLLIDVLAVTGTRPSQAVRLTVDDFVDHPLTPALLVPDAGKGGNRNRAGKKRRRTRLAITPELAARLRAAKGNRYGDMPLLLQADGTPWAATPADNYHRRVDAIVTAIGLDPTKVTAYSLRHSSVVRQLLKNVPARVVAALHNTSVTMIETHYTKHIADYASELSRASLLWHAPVEFATAAG
jgi:integrase